MKKFIALAIAVLMLATLAVPAFATQSVTPDNATLEDVVVTYEIAEEYSIEIPAAIDFETGANVVYEGNFEADKTVSVASANGWEVKRDGDEDGVAYVLTAGETETTDVVAEIAAGVNEETTVALTFDWADAAPETAGTYTDTLTFTVA